MRRLAVEAVGGLDERLDCRLGRAWVAFAHTPRRYVARVNSIAVA